jgi:O-antigen/teichoic acid export membrane protein
MRNRGRIAGALLWTWGGVGTSMIVGFLLAPFLVNHLGDTSYGIWVVIGSLTTSFGLLDLGTRSSVGRNVAFFRAKGDQDGVNAVVSTAQVVLVTVAAVVLALTLAASLWFNTLFDVPPDQEGRARLAFVLVGTSLAVSLALEIFEVTLWSHQRFGILSGIGITADLVRAALTFYFVGAGHGLVALAVITLVTTTGKQTAMMAASLGVNRRVRVSPRLVTRAALRLIFGFGFWSSLLTVGKMLTQQSGAIVIAARLGVGWVTPFAIAQRLVTFALAIIANGAQALVPMATALHARQLQQDQQRLFVVGGRFNLILVLFFVPCYLLLGGPFITLWIGPGYESSALLLAVIALGETLPMSQHVSRTVILGMGLPRVLAVVNLVENLVAITTATAVARPFGLMGVALTYAVCGAVGRGVVQVVLACRLVGLPVRTYVARAVLPALAVVAVPAAGLALLASWRPPSSWVELIAYGSAYSGCYLSATYALVVGPGRLVARRVLRRVAKTS